MPPVTISASETIPICGDRAGSLRVVAHPDGDLGHDHERRDLHQAEDAGAVDEALHQALDHLRGWAAAS